MNIHIKTSLNTSMCATISTKKPWCFVKYWASASTAPICLFWFAEDWTNQSMGGGRMAGFLLILEYHFSSLNLGIVEQETHKIFIKNTVKVLIRTAEAFVIQIIRILSHAAVVFTPDILRHFREFTAVCKCLVWLWNRVRFVAKTKKKGC